MEDNPSEDMKDSSINNIYDISLIPQSQINNTPDKIDLNVILSFPYQKESFNIKVRTSIIKEENTNELQFSMGDIISQIFSKVEDIFKEEYFLSYYLNEENELENSKKDDGTTIFNYLGEINKGNNFYQNLYLKVPKDNIVFLKMRQKIKIEKLVDPDFFEENEKINSNSVNMNLNEDKEEEKINTKRGCRTNEKTIEYAILKAFIYELIRKINIKISQFDACKMINIPKKTLDIYKKNIIKGKIKGFNFKKYYKSKMHVLNEFIDERNPKEDKIK